MEAIKIKARTSEDGMLKLEVPTGLSGRDVEVILVMHAAESLPVDANGWPVGFFDRTYGTLADDPIEREPQLPLKERDPLE